MSLGLISNPLGRNASTGGAGGSGTVSSGTTNVLAKYTAATTVGDSLFTDTGTTATYTGTGGFVAPVFTGSGTTPGALQLTAGTGSIPALAANSAGFAAPATGGTSYLIKFPATITAGVPVLAAPGTVDGVNESAMTVVAGNTLGTAALVGTYASPDTTGGAVTITAAITQIWTNTTTTYTLPAISTWIGKGLIFYVVGTNLITIDPNASEIIVRNGTAQTGGVTLTLAGVAGNYVCLLNEGSRIVTLGFSGTLAAGS